VVPLGIRTSIVWSELTLIGSLPLRTHIGFVSSHANKLKIANGYQESGKAPSQSVRAGAAMHRSPECTSSPSSSIIEPGVATREGKGGHQTAEVNFSFSTILGIRLAPTKRCEAHPSHDHVRVRWARHMQQMSTSKEPTRSVPV